MPSWAKPIFFGFLLSLCGAGIGFFVKSVQASNSEKIEEAEEKTKMKMQIKQNEEKLDKLHSVPGDIRVIQQKMFDIEKNVKDGFDDLKQTIQNQQPR